MIKCLTWMRLWGCWPWCHNTEVIIICIGHDALASKPWCLKKHLEIICVHLGLLFFSQRQQQLCPGITMPCYHHPVINDDCSSSWHTLIKPVPNQSVNQRESSLSLKGVVVQQCFFRDHMRKTVTASAVCGAGRTWSFLFPSRSRFLPSTYLPETPFPGHWPSQFASSLSKHFTGEHLFLHLPIARATTCGHARTYTHITLRTITHTDMTASNLPLC